MQKAKAGLMRFEMKMRTLLGIGVKAIHVTLWQITCLHFVHNLRLCKGLSLKGMNYFTWDYSILGSGMGVSGCFWPDLI